MILMITQVIMKPTYDDPNQREEYEFPWGKKCAEICNKLDDDKREEALFKALKVIIKIFSL